MLFMPGILKKIVAIVHIANFLSTCDTLMLYKPYVFLVSPKATSNYHKFYIGM